MAQRELITLTEARRRLGISRVTMTRLVQEGRFTVYTNPVDRREKLVDAAEVRDYATPKILPEGKEAAAA